ncbi:MAG: hypothetical protein D8M59_06130 [Planctomycetes bacterium]|nr:hypothetical protein [Planctomycetota bacterium]NOG55075.1 hypothetical protein [Planctomycetota bacterium]
MMTVNKRLMTMSCLTAATALGLGTSALGQTPASATSGGTYGNGDKAINPQNSALATTVLYDSLFIIDGQTHDISNGDGWAGRAVFGDVFDLRCADDFLVFTGGFTITRVTADFLTFNGTAPTSVYTRIYPSNGGVPGETPLHEKASTGASVTSTPFTDTIFGYAGQRIVAEDLCMPLGANSSDDGCPYWVTIQPSHTGTAGDWYYFARDTTLSYLYETAGRDGELGLGGYGTTSWTPMTGLGYGPGYGSMKLEGNAGRLTTHPPTPGFAGGVNSVEVHGCNPGASVQLFYSTSTGTTTVPGCPGVCLNLQNAKTAGVKTADANGVASWSGSVGSGLKGKTAYHQAVDKSTCCVSPVMVWTYPN